MGRKHQSVLYLDISKKPGDPNAVKTDADIIEENEKLKEQVRRRTGSMTINERLIATAFGHAQSARNDLQCVANLISDFSAEFQSAVSSAYRETEQLVQSIRDELDSRTSRMK